LSLSSTWRSHKGDLLALAVIILGLAIFHYRGLRPGYTFLPVDLANNLLPWRAGEYRPLQNRLISDPLYEFYPFLAHAVNTVKEQKEWPLWNPHLFAGHPTLADPLAQPFYPVYLILGLALGAARGLAVGLWLHVVLAALLTYGLLRVLKCRPYAAAAGAFTYALSGYLVTWFEHTHRTTTLAWLPGVVWALELAIRRRQMRYLGLGAVMACLAILGGQYQFLVTFGLFLGFYALGRTLQASRERGRFDYWPLLVAGLMMAFGGLLSAFQLLPFWEFLSLSHRAQSVGLTDPIPIKNLITLLTPDFYGNPSLPGPYWGEGGYSEATIYAGLVSLFLAALAPFWRRDFYTRYLFGLGAAAVYFVAGGPGVRWLAVLPFFQYASLKRSAFILPLIVAMLAALALTSTRAKSLATALVSLFFAAILGFTLFALWEQAEGYWSQLQGPVYLALGLLALTAGLLIFRQRVSVSAGNLALNWAITGLIFLDLFLWGSRFNPAGLIDELLPPTPAIDYLRQHSSPYRVAAYQHEVLLGPNIPSIYGIAEAGGYTSVQPELVRRLVLADNPDIWWMAENPNVVIFTRPSQRLLDVLQVGHVISPVLLDDPGIRAEHMAEGCVSAGDEISTESPVEGAFMVRNTAINRLDLRFWVDEPDTAEGNLVIRLWQGERQVMEARQAAGALIDQQPLTLYFTPEQDAPGRLYRWEVAVEGATGVKLCLGEDGQPAISVFGAEHNLVHQGRVFVYQRTLPLPRAFVAYAAEPVSDDEQAIARLLDEAFDHRQVVVIAEPVDLPLAPSQPIDRAEITAYEDTRVEIRATAAAPGLLVLGDQHYPGWYAYLNGQPVPIVRTNLLFRGVQVPAGEHEVVFEFAPQSLKVGLAVSLIALSILLASLFTGMKIRGTRRNS
jgi:hypothetical protein